MNQNKVGKFSGHQIDYWKNLILFLFVCFIIFYTIGLFATRQVPGDYLGYWSVGKIFDQKGFSEVYNLENLHTVQLGAIDRLGYPEELDELLYSTMPVPYLSFFLLPFTFLSRIDVIFSYQTWTLLNLVILIGYLVFFLRRTSPGCMLKVSNLRLLLLMLISWPVIINITCGQVEVFLLVCSGEFLRHSLGKKPLLSGIWLGGMLLKPQLLILVIPILLIKRNWKLLGGFCLASGIILLVSFALSGFSGFAGLLNLWIKQSGGMLLSGLKYMMNWRMIGVNINALTNTSFGWVVTGLGMVLTILAVCIMVKKTPSFGSSAWVMTMLGIFSATLAITWHAHAHMAMILIPFLMYASIQKLLPEKIIFLWAITSQVTLIGVIIINLYIFSLVKLIGPDYTLIAIGFSAFIVNLIILLSTLKLEGTPSEALAETAG